MENIFDGSILAEVINFNGEFKPYVGDDDTKFCIHSRLGTMTPLEITLWTLKVLREEEMEKIISENFYEITGKKKNEMSEKIYVKTKLLILRENFNLLKKYHLLEMESENFENIMWKMIKSRVKRQYFREIEMEENRELMILPGYEIVAGHELKERYVFGLRMLDTGLCS